MHPDPAIDELRTRLFDLEAQVEEMREQLAAAGNGGGVPTPPPPLAPPPPLVILPCVKFTFVIVNV